MQNSRILSAMLCGASVISLAGAAQAQAQAQAPVVAAQTAPGAAQPAAGAGDQPPPVVDRPLAADPAASPSDIVITGSRVIQNGNSSPTPVTVVSVAALQNVTPSTVPDALNRLPIFNGSGSPNGITGAANSNSSANTLNLRSIGAGRTLVLFDGLRVPSNNVDTLPQMLMQRVEVVTGGASAVYGSDAVAGVVNFIIDRKFNGLRMNAQAGISGYGDDLTQRIGIAAGRSFLDGRLHLEASAEYYNSPGIEDKLTRSFYRKVYTTQGSGTAANPYRLVPDSRIVNTSFYGKILSGPLNDYVFRTPGVVSPFIHGGPSGTGSIESGGDGGFYATASMKALLENGQFFGRADYELTDNIKVWAQGTYVKGHNRNTHQLNEFRSITLNSQNGFLPAAIRAQYAAANQPTLLFSKMMRAAPTLQPETFYGTQIYSGGIEGTLGKFNWNFAALHSVAKQTTRNNANVRNDRAAAALDAVINPATGQVVCNVTLTNPGLYPGCAPLNLFGPETESQAAINYILEVTSFRSKNTLDEYTGSIAGSPFDTWAGPVQIAFSGEYRKLKSDTISNAQPTDRADCTGLRYNCNASTPRWVSNVVADLRNQSQEVTEGAVEVEVPLIKDLPLVKSFSVNGAARRTHYDTSGSVTTWKVGGVWFLADGLSVRATRSRDIRAPTVAELFSPISINPAGIQDLHTNTTGNIPVVSQGNANLKPEVANTLTAGIVYRPTWLQNFSVAVDLYRIRIGNGIGNVSGNNATVARECEASNGTSSLCDLFIRPLPFSNRTPANFPTQILSQSLNIASFYSKGIDTEVNYATSLGSDGRLSLRALATYQPKQVSVSIPGTTPLNAAGAAGLPKWRVTAFATYTKGDFSLNLQQRWHSSTKRSSDPNQVFLDPKVAAFYTTDLTLSYFINAFGGKNQVFLTTQNLFNRKPPIFVGPGGGSGIPGWPVVTTNGDDAVGRYFTVGMRFKI